MNQTKQASSPLIAASIPGTGSLHRLVKRQVEPKTAASTDNKAMYRKCKGLWIDMKTIWLIGCRHE
jgi:hypothetical protein